MSGRNSNVLPTTFFQNLSARIADRFGHSLDKIFEPPARWLRWFLIYIIPFIIGSRFESAIQSLDFDGSLFRLSTWQELLKNHWVSLPLAGLFLLGIAWRRDIDYKKSKLASLRELLDWLYYDLGFHDETLQDADVRLTIWAPVRRVRETDTYRLKQIVDYVPRIRKVAGGYRRSKPAGRVFRVARQVEGQILYIGLIGKCTIDCFTRNKPVAYREVVPEGVDFEDYMVQNWNFTPVQARSLTPNRRAYMCVPVMNSESAILYGIIYLDARDPDALTARVGTRIIDDYLLRVARIFTT